MISNSVVGKVYFINKKYILSIIFFFFAKALRNPQWSHYIPKAKEDILKAGAGPISRKWFCSLKEENKAM